MCDLAIVIPAYKYTFIKSTLDSIVKQTNTNFNVYIGDDCSPEDLYSVIREYESRITIFYKRFDNNLGGENLVAQWERCIDLVQDEEWVWLFSDDDIMEVNCVERFYDEIVNKKPLFDLYHFDVKVIDEENRILKYARFPSCINSEQLLIQKLRGRLNSYVVEFIFRKSTFEKLGRFQFFDLAWNSDISTWVKLGYDKGIKTIEGAHVLWRASGENISPNHKDLGIVRRKIEANIDFSEWLRLYCKQHRMNFLRFVPYLTTWFLVSLKLYKNVLDSGVIANSIQRYFKAIKFKVLYPIGSFYFWFKSVK